MQPETEIEKTPEMTDEPEDGDWSGVLPPPDTDEEGDEIIPPAPPIEGEENAEEKTNDDDDDGDGDGDECVRGAKNKVNIWLVLEGRSERQKCDRL